VATEGKYGRMAREKIVTTTPDIAAERMQELRRLFPDAFTEGKVDLDKLRLALGQDADDRPERYTFSWAGKKDAIRVLQTPTRATLKPVKSQSINPDTTGNIFIEGDNLETLKLLYKSYAGRVKLIYIDPPYNTGGEFIYPDDYADPLAKYLALTGQVDSKGNILTSNAETGGRYHSSWLSMMYPRLFLARQLLREDGAIFVSLDDHEIHDLRMLMNEIFGEENFVATVIWQKVFAPKNTARHFSEDHDYIVVYARNAELWRPDLLPRTEEQDEAYKNPDNDPRGPWKPSDMVARNYYSKGVYPVTCPSGRVISGPRPGTYWRVPPEKFLKLDKDKRIWWGVDGDKQPMMKRFRTEVMEGRVPQTLWFYGDVGHTKEAKERLMETVAYEQTDNVLDSVKPPRLIQRILQIATTPDENDIVLDFFAGSGITADAVLTQNNLDGGNRRFICVQLPEPLPVPEPKLKTLCDVARQRIASVAKQLKKDSEGKLATDSDKAPQDLGVRVFSLAESQFMPWVGVSEKSADAYAGQMELHTDPLVHGWKPETVIWEVAIKEGYSLASRVDKGTVGEATVWTVTDDDKGQSFRVCLDDKLTMPTVKKLDLGTDDLFVCRDSAISDAAAANLALQCRLKTI
jgi:adenine-specific DNA-methyltransferase